ncbi:MAG: O-antigen ligase family protein [Patescibacteria group bacterium]|jgi:O-antigen ligase
MYEIIIITLLVGYGLIAWRDFRLAVFLFLAALPVYLLRLDLFGFPTTMLELMFGVITIGWLIKIVLEKPDFSFAKPWLIPFILLLVAGVIGVAVAPDKLSALGTLKAYLVEPIIFFFILYTALKKFDDAERALMFLGLGALAAALFAIYQRLTGQAIPIPWDIEGRATSFFPYPNALGLYLGPIIVLGLGSFWRSLKAEFYLRAGFWFLTVGAAVAAIIFSQTEAAWVAIPAALLIISLFSKAARWRVIVLIIIGIIIVFSFTTIKQKIFLQDYSGGVRLKQWEETFNMLKDNWLFGAGLSGYPTALEPYHTHKEIEIFQYPHNLILNIWTELGLLGLFAATYLVLVSFKAFYQGKKKQASFNWLVFASGAALIEMAIHGLVDVPFFKNDLAMLTAAILVFLVWSATGPYAYKNDVIEE